MAGKIKDRVGESISGNGVANVATLLDLAGALESLQSFSDAFDLSGGSESDVPAVLSTGNDWQTGKGTFDDAANTFVFSVIEDSSAAGAAISFDENSELRCTPTSEIYNGIVAGGPTNLGNIPAADSVQITSSTGTPTTIAEASGAAAGVMSVTQVNDLAGKAAEVHTHVEDDVTDLDKYTQAEVDARDAFIQLDLDSHKNADNYHLTSDQNDAIDGANAPDAGNVLATMADIASAGGGDVTGPASSTDGNMAVFSGTTGKIIRDGGPPGAGGGGDVTGPASATDNNLAAFDGATGKLIKDAAASTSDFEPAIGTKNTAFNKDFGAVADTVCQGNDARLSDARAPTAHTHIEDDITDLDKYTQAEVDAALAPKIEALFDDPTPKLAGPLDVQDQHISFVDAAKTTQIGAIISNPDDSGFSLAAVDGTNYDPVDGGISIEKGKLGFFGATSIFEHLKGQGSQQVYVSDDGGLYGVTPPDPGWQETDTSTDVVTLSGLQTWHPLPTLSITIPQDVSAGDRVDVSCTVWIQEYSVNRDGTVSIGIGINGSPPASIGRIAPVPGGYAGPIDLAFSTTTHGGLTAGDVIQVWARRETQSHASYDPRVNGALGEHELIVSVPAQGGGTSLTNATFPTHAKFASQVAATANVDFTAGNCQEITDATGLTINLTAPGVGHYTLVLENNSDQLVGFGTVINWENGTVPVWSGRSIVLLYFTGTIWIGAGMVGVA